MKTKTLFLPLLLVLLAFAASFSTAQAQCSVCNSTISPIFYTPTTSTFVRVANVKTTYSSLCSNPTYVWTSTPAAGVGIVNSGPTATFTFPSPGMYYICCTFTVTGPFTTCSVTSCDWVTIP